MGRLIDAEKLKAHYSWWKDGTREMTMGEAKDIFDDIVDLQPTVDAESLITQHEDIGYERGYRDGYAEALEVTDDAEPVRHGHWAKGIGMMHCSECGTAWWNEIYIRGFKYCPYCGAKMDVADMDVGKMEVEE